MTELLRVYEVVVGEGADGLTPQRDTADAIIRYVTALRTAASHAKQSLAEQANHHERVYRNLSKALTAIEENVRLNLRIEKMKVEHRREIQALKAEIAAMRDTAYG